MSCILFHRESIISLSWWNDPKVEKSSKQVFTKWKYKPAARSRSNSKEKKRKERQREIKKINKTIVCINFKQVSIFSSKLIKIVVYNHLFLSFNEVLPMCELVRVLMDETSSEWVRWWGIIKRFFVSLSFYICHDWSIQQALFHWMAQWIKKFIWIKTFTLYLNSVIK